MTEDKKYKIFYLPEIKFAQKLWKLFLFNDLKDTFTAHS